MSFESSLQRAALVVKNLPRQHSHKLLALLEPDERAKLFESIRELPDYRPSLVDVARRRFIQHVTDSPHTQTKPSKKISERPFAYLEGISEKLLFELLADEHPSIIATVISYLSADDASNLLLSLEPVARVAVLRRLCRVNNRNQVEIEKLARQIQVRLKQLLDMERTQNSGIEIASKLLSCTDGETRESLIEIMDLENGELGSQLKRRVFVFDELAKIQDSVVKIILHWTDTSLWAPALRFAAPNVRRKILQNVAERPRNIIVKEISDLNALEPVVGQQAQLEVVKSIMRLVEQGKISLSKGRSNRNDQRAA